MFWGNRNGFFYVLDRGTGKFLAGRPFVKVNWASGLDAQRPANHHVRRLRASRLSRAFKAEQTGIRRLTARAQDSFYLSTWENYATIFSGVNADYREGQRYTGGANTSPIPGADNPVGQRQGPVNTYTEALAHGAVVALNPETGKPAVEIRNARRQTSGILTTASDLLLSAAGKAIFSLWMPARARCFGRKTWEGKSSPAR